MNKAIMIYKIIKAIPEPSVNRVIYSLSVSLSYFGNDMPRLRRKAINVVAKETINICSMLFILNILSNPKN